MPVTYKQIAEIVGVSRGTVDRALNDRGRIAPDVKKRIQQVAAELGFSPSHIGRALAKARTPVKIGVVVHLARIPFFKQVIKGIRQARTEIANLGGEVLVEEIPSLDAAMQLRAVDSLVRQGVRGLAVSPAHDEALRDRLNELNEQRDMPVITFNTDIKGLRRMCYVGLDNQQAGRAAAGLMNLLLKEKEGKVFIVSGFSRNPANIQRTDGFIMEAAARFPNIIITGRQFNRDENERAYDIVTSEIQKTPDLAAVYMVSSGQAGACRAIEDAGRAGQIKMIVYDTLPDTVEYIRKGVIDFIVDQNAFMQGNLPPRLLFECIFDGKAIGRDNIFTEIGIKTKYNV